MRRSVRENRKFLRGLGGGTGLHSGALKENRLLYLFSSPRLNSLEARTREKRTRVRFGLLRLRTAARLYELERGRPVEQIDDLAPEYLPALPIDYFSPDGAPLKWAESERADFYSIGPDEVDDEARIPYGATSGAMSPGDIF